jgi:hypothetical protein
MIGAPDPSAATAGLLGTIIARMVLPDNALSR